MKNKTKTTKRAVANTKPRTKDLAIIVLLSIFAFIASWVLPIGFLVSSLLFFGLPALYLSFKKRREIVRCLAFAATFSIPGGMVWDYFAEKDGSWYIHTIFPFKIFGVVTIEAIAWAFLISYLIVIYYESFVDHRRHAKVGKHMRYMFLLFFGSLLLFILFVILPKATLIVSYTYLIGGILLLGMPLLGFIFSYHRYFSGLLKTIPYFFSLALLEEIVALRKGYWTFPGSHFIGWVTLSPDIRFPIEELVFWIVLCSAAILAYFEFFDDNNIKWTKLAVKIKR